jgi:hypothetical protein
MNETVVLGSKQDACWTSMSIHYSAGSDCHPWHPLTFLQFLITKYWKVSDQVTYKNGIVGGKCPPPPSG